MGARPVRSPRLLRGSVLAAASTLLGVAAHAAAGGASLHPDVLVPLALLTAAVGACLVGANPRPARVVGVLAVAQAAMHALFVLNHQAHPHTGVVGPVTRTFGHVGAVVAIGMMLAHADSVLACLTDAVAAVRPMWWTPPVPVTEHVPWVPTWVDTDQRRQPGLPARNCPRRGPPVHV